MPYTREPLARSPGALVTGRSARNCGPPVRTGAVVAGLVLSAGLGWWWADPTAGYVLVLYAAREARAILAGQH